MIFSVGGWSTGFCPQKDIQQVPLSCLQRCVITPMYNTDAEKIATSLSPAWVHFILMPGVCLFWLFLLNSWWDCILISQHWPRGSSKCVYLTTMHSNVVNTLPDGSIPWELAGCICHPSLAEESTTLWETIICDLVLVNNSTLFYLAVRLSAHLFSSPCLFQFGTQGCCTEFYLALLPMAFLFLPRNMSCSTMAQSDLDLFFDNAT